MENRQIILKISAELLRQVLKLPADTRIDGFSPHVYFTEGCYAIRVESERFPLRCDYEALSVAIPLVEEGTGQFLGWMHPAFMGEMDYSTSPAEPPETSTLIGPVTPEDKTALIADLQGMHFSELVQIYDRTNRVVGIGCKLRPTDDAPVPHVVEGKR